MRHHRHLALISCRGRHGAYVLAAWPLAVFVLVVPSLLVAQSYLTGLVFVRRGAGFVPIAGARVEARGTGEGALIHSVTTDSSGRYFLGGLQAGELTITATHARFYAAQNAERGGGTVVRCPASGACAKADFEMLPAGELEISVVDSLGLPVEDASVEIRRLDEPGPVQGPAVRTGHGVFSSRRNAAGAL